MSHTPVIALAGTPNAGKSALFNALTGSRQKVGNYPGVTVERKYALCKTPQGHQVNFIDLPGTYSLDPQSPDEQVSLDILLDKDNRNDHPDLIVAVCDATNLERTLGLILELKQLNHPVICALNMMDLALKRGVKIDQKKLSEELGCPVVPTIAINKQGVRTLLDKIDQTIPQLDMQSPHPAPTWTRPTPLEIKQRFVQVDQILKACQHERTKADIWTQRIDRVVLHPVFGGLLLAAIMLLMFQAVFSWASTPMDWIEGGIEILGAGVGTWVTNETFHSLLVDGVIAGVGAVIVFLPQILILFFFIFLLETSGYMTRAAFILDRFMGLFGLQGRAFVPLLSSFACAIPGVMATRTIRDPKERMLTLLVSPLMTCSARLPVYVLLIGAFIPNQEVWGMFNLQGLVMFGLFLAGILSAMVVAWAFSTTMLKGAPSPFLLEMPSYKWPNWRYVTRAIWQRGKVFIKRAGTLILLIAMGLWFLSTYPKAPEDWSGPDITYSYAGRIGQTIEPLVAPLGFDWRIATGLIPGFAAREVMVGALATVFAVEAEDEDAQAASLHSQLQASWPLATGLALLVWYIFAPQCLATFAVVKRETNSRKWPIIMFFYMLALAYISAFLVYNVVSALS